MHQHVGLQIVPLHVRLATDGTHKFPLGRMPFDVGLKSIDAKVRLWTLFTLEDLFVAMFSLVTLAGHRGRELEATDRTDVPLGQVDSLLVDLESIVVGEAFVTDRAFYGTVLVLAKGRLDFISSMGECGVSHQFV